MEKGIRVLRKPGRVGSGRVGSDFIAVLVW